MLAGTIDFGMEFPPTSPPSESSSITHHTYRLFTVPQFNMCQGAAFPPTPQSYMPLSDLRRYITTPAQAA